MYGMVCSIGRFTSLGDYANSQGFSRGFHVTTTAIYYTNQTATTEQFDLLEQLHRLDLPGYQPISPACLEQICRIFPGLADCPS